MGWICDMRMRRDGRDDVGGRFSLGPLHYGASEPGRHDIGWHECWLIAILVISGGD